MGNVVIPEWLDVPVIQEWQLNRLMDNLYLTNKYRDFPGLFTQAFYFRPEGIDSLEYRGRKFRVVKTLGKTDLQWYKETYFTEPHTVLQMPMAGKLLLIGFWAQNLTELKTWIQEQIPHANTSDLVQRVFTRQIDLD